MWKQVTKRAYIQPWGPRPAPLPVVLLGDASSQDAVFAAVLQRRNWRELRNTEQPQAAVGL